MIREKPSIFRSRALIDDSMESRYSFISRDAQTAIWTDVNSTQKHENETNNNKPKTHTQTVFISNSYSAFVTTLLLGLHLRREMEFIISCLKWQNAAKANRSLTRSRGGCKHLFWECCRAAQRLPLRATTRSCCGRGRNLATSILSWAAQCSRAYYTLAICLKWSDHGGNVVLPGPLKKKKSFIEKCGRPQHMRGSQMMCQVVFFILKLKSCKLKLSQPGLGNEN